MDAYSYVQYADADKFAEVALPFYFEHEAMHCLQIGLVQAIRDGHYADARLSAVIKDDQVVLAMLQTPPFPALLSFTDDAKAVQVLVDGLSHAIIPEQMSGPIPVIEQFALAWSSRHETKPTWGEHERIYQLDTVIPVTGVAGYARRATLDDFDVLLPWYQAFHLEALGNVRDDLDLVLRTRLQDPGPGGGWVWIANGKPVTYVGAGNLTPNGIRIGPVYTPPEFRKNGYASALTAHVSQELLDAGRTFCFLFTDMTNPTSNHIYQEVGYRPVVDIKRVKLHADS